jgi:ADP-heptose:LPS heptosyltransferase
MSGVRTLLSYRAVAELPNPTARLAPARSRWDVGGQARALDPQHILLGLLCPIGDTLFATPALAALRRRFPHARVSALVYHSNVGILTGNPAIDECIFAAPGEQAPGLYRFMRGVGALQRADYDLMVNFSPAASFVGLLVGVQDQVHLRMPRHWWLIGGQDATYQRRHAVDHYLRLIRPLLDEEVPEAERQPRVYVSARDRAAARRLLRSLDVAPTGPLVAMHAGGDGFAGRKRWSTRRFAEVGRHLIDNLDARVLLLGGASDLTLAEEVAADIGTGATVLAGRTSLLETAALIERSALFIGNDSCPLHIAAAVGTPSVGIFGPSSVHTFRPVGPPGYAHQIVSAGLACSPCFHFVGNNAPWVPNPCHSYACLKAIETEHVLTAALELLAAREPGDRPADGAVAQPACR